VCIEISLQSVTPSAAQMTGVRRILRHRRILGVHDHLSHDIQLCLLQRTRTLEIHIPVSCACICVHQSQVFEFFVTAPCLASGKGAVFQHACYRCQHACYTPNVCASVNCLPHARWREEQKDKEEEDEGLACNLGSATDSSVFSKMLT